jgi:hypothetical protein
MTPSDQRSFDQLDVSALTALLLDPDAGDDVHRGALSAFSRISPEARNDRLVKILKRLFVDPDRYNLDVMTAAIDLLATDPNPDATAAMLEILPDMIHHTLRGKAIPTDFRAYFYLALMTRQREEDLRVWGEMLDIIDSLTLVGIIVDPAAAPLEGLEPWTLLNRQPEPDRTTALITILGLATRRGGLDSPVSDAIEALAESRDAETFEEGLDRLSEQWEQAKKAGRKNHADGLQAALEIMDKRPRTASERLTGKRPWAP